ncbi:MAG TPA: crosslink repair DNA glycosylase YcaQ family protein [Acidimicrobiia bacterium]
MRTGTDNYIDGIRRRCYVGLWSRLEGFHRPDLDRALERRTVVQGTLLRATIHLVSARDYWPFAVAIGAARREWWLRVQTGRLAAEDIAAAAGRLRPHLAAGRGGARNWTNWSERTLPAPSSTSCAATWAASGPPPPPRSPTGPACPPGRWPRRWSA